MYLATGIPFSSNVSTSERDTKVYLFGGMCPTTSTTGDSWVSTANYSATMLAYSPVVSGNAITYNENQVSTRNYPIAQAGHTMTALRPTYSNRTDGSQTQQQNFVLLGGHTQNAFINMSQVALYSLPQESWSYFPVSQPNGDTATEVQPRSGHTATLSADGTQIVVVGGWVGNVNTPATPSIAVLNVAEIYGGAGDWTWTIPSTPSGSGLALNTGIYGHGAMILPGNVLLVVGGYAIPAPAASKWRRATVITQTANSKAFFYNITSNTWLTDYTAPISTSSQGMTSPGPLSKTSQKAGLGIGISIGAVAVVALLVLYFWHAKRQKRRRDDLDSEIKSHVFATHQNGADEWGITHAENRVVVADTTRHSTHSTEGRELAHGWRASGAVEAERTGLLVEIPSPTRGLRRNVSGRSPYPYEKRANRNMEPIAERTALEERPEMQIHHHNDLQIQTSALLGNPPTLDPFNDADPLRSHPLSLENSPSANRTNVQRDEEVKGWMEDWEKAAQALITPGISQQKPIAGRQSPTKSERTESTLSEQSMHSSFSSRSGPAGAGGVVRSWSVRSTALLNSFTSSFGTATSPTTAQTDARMTLPSQQRRPIPSRSNTDVFATATTPLSRLQDEGQSLLPSPTKQALAVNTRMSKSRFKSALVSPTNENGTVTNIPLNRPKKGTSWVGSIRRVISGAVVPQNRAQSMTSASATSSPIKAYHDIPDEWERTASPPPNEGMKRAVSDAAFWKSKRGQKDWLTGSDDEDGNPSEAILPSISKTPGTRRPRAQSTTQPPSASSSRPVTGATEETDGRRSGDTEEDDWDVERAAENRVVQLMFTVPRQRLRVVNCDPDNQSLATLATDRDDGSKGGGDGVA
jgi:hypothetical protein